MDGYAHLAALLAVVYAKEKQKDLFLKKVGQELTTILEMVQHKQARKDIEKLKKELLK